VKRAVILAVGRQKDSALRELCEDYYRRCSRSLQIEEREVRDLATLKRALPARGFVVLLDERGEQVTSRQFAQLLQRWVESPFPQLAFVIGGAEGLDDELRARGHYLLSLGKMTFAHRLVRLLLAEQLYRAVSLAEGAPYHRD